MVKVLRCVIDSLIMMQYGFWMMYTNKREIEEGRVKVRSKQKSRKFLLNCERENCLLSPSDLK